MYDFFNAQPKPREAAQCCYGGWKSSTARPFSDHFAFFRWNFGRTPRRMHSVGRVRAGCSYFLVTSPRAISIMECGRKINTQISRILLSTFESIFTDFSHVNWSSKVQGKILCSFTCQWGNEHYSEKLKVDIQRYFTWIIFREIAQRVHANPSNDNFRPHRKH